MAITIKKPPTLSERIRERHHRSNEFLDDERAPATTGWGKVHLYAADTVDTVVTAANNKYLMAGLGLAYGLARGLIIGAVIGLAVATFFPFTIAVGIPAAATSFITATAPSALQFMHNVCVTAMATSVVLGVHDTRAAFVDAQRESIQGRGGRIAEKIAKHGHAIGSPAPPALDKAMQRTIEREHIKPPPAPHPAAGENHSFVEAEMKRKALQQEGVRL